MTLRPTPDSPGNDPGNSASREPIFAHHDVAKQELRDILARPLNEAKKTTRDVVEELAWQSLASTQEPLSVPLPKLSGNPPTESLSIPSLSIGSQVGPYQIIASGGPCDFGTVYQGIKLDDPAQIFTLQFFQIATSAEQFLTRFRTDPASRLAAVKHPNIAASLDSGTTEAGQGYIVSKYVDGQPIDMYCENLKLNISERLKLFAWVCDIVQFAHQHTVIHRDLKPFNILVTTDGAPTLTNFGITSLVELDSPTARRTPLEYVSAFASPEQVMGETLTTAVDIYALGAILYELLSGHGPYRLENPSPNETLQAICDQIAQKPSVAIKQCPNLPEAPTAFASSGTSLSSLPTPEQIAAARGSSLNHLERALSGDLDSIVLMALRKEPSRRYASANQFAEDIRRYQNHLPVRARQDIWHYRLVKFLRRHQLLTTTALGILLSLCMGLLVTGSSLISARRDLDQAAEMSDQGRQTINKIFAHTTGNQLLEQAEIQALRKTLLEDVQHFYRALVDQHPSRFTRSPELAEASSDLAMISDLIGTRAEAAARYDIACSLWKKLVAEHPAELEYREKLAMSLTEFSMVLAQIPERLEQALQSLHEARNLIERFLSANPQSIQTRRRWSLTFLNEALICSRQGHAEQAMLAINTALSLITQLGAEDSHSLDAQLANASVYSSAGAIFAGQAAEQLEAVTAYEKAIAIRLNVLRDHPELDEEAYRLALDQNHLGDLLQRRGQLDTALQSFRHSLELLDGLDQRYPNRRQYQLGRGIACNAIAELLRRHNEAAESLTMAQNARDRLQRLLSQYPNDVTARLELAKSHNIVGRVLERAGRQADALLAFQRAVDIYETMMPNLEASNIYHFACNISLCIPLIGKPNVPAIPKTAASAREKADELRRGFYADRAIQVLRLVIRKRALSAESLETNTDLDPLRQRPDFAQLLKDVEKQSMPNEK